MAKVTVKQLAETVKVPVDRLLKQMQEAGLSHSADDDVVAEEEKQQLLAHLQKFRGDSQDSKKKIIFQFANELISQFCDLAAIDFDTETNFPINSYVLVEYETGRKPDKGSYPLHGPYQVIGKQGSVYTVRHLVTNNPYQAQTLPIYHPKQALYRNSL